MVSTKSEFSLILHKNAFDVSDQQIELLASYVDLLKEWNCKINLVSRRDIEQIWVRQILASISFLFRLTLQSPSRVLDLGTGGGLPGVPLAILHPNLKFVLVDSVHKKIGAVENIITKLDLSNAQAICARAQDLKNEKKYAAAFDYVISRGVGSVADIVKLSRDFLRLKVSFETTLEGKTNTDRRQLLGRPAIILLKGGDIDDEVARARMRANPVSINIVPTIVDGVTSEELFDKKCVIVQP